MSFLQAGKRLAIAIALVSSTAQAQDSLRLTLPQAEGLFLQRNLAVLAGRYNLTSAEAAVVQARLFPNPVVSLEYNLYNPNTSTFLPSGRRIGDNGQYPGGQVAASITQLIQLAGKRSKLVQLTLADQQLARYQFADLLRTLRLELRTAYASLYYDSQELDLYQEEQTRLAQVIAATRFSLQRGIVSPYEITRLEAEAQDVAARLSDLRAAISTDQANLRLLISERTPAYIVATEAPALRQLPLTPALRDTALARRPDYLAAQAATRRADLNLNYQKAQAIPDLQLGLAYDRFGSAYSNYSAVQLAMPLPFFARNQGAIRGAKVGRQIADAGLAQAETQVVADLEEARRTLAAYQTQAAGVTPDYLQRLAELSTQAERAYRARTISLLDYLDKFRIYKTGSSNQLDLQQSLYIATETLATAAGMP